MPGWFSQPQKLPLGLTWWLWGSGHFHKGANAQACPGHRFQNGQVWVTQVLGAALIQGPRALEPLWISEWSRSVGQGNKGQRATSEKRGPGAREGSWPS